MVAAMVFDTQVVGVLPVIQPFLQPMNIAAIIDEVVPWQGTVPLGILAEIMISNRLMNPQAMYRIGPWADQVGLTRFYEVTPELLNDDRLGRALERLGHHAHRLENALVLHVIKQFDLDVQQIHYDITSAELYGAYEQPPITNGTTTGPQPVYGHTQSGRKHVKQVQVGLNVTADGGVPVGHQPFDANLSETTAHLENLKQLRTRLPQNRLLVGDSKLDSAENLLRIHGNGGQFICAGVMTPARQQHYLRNRHKMRTIDYPPKSQAKRAPEERDAYKAYETTELLVGESDGVKVRLHHRVIYVWSEAKERQQVRTRERHLDKIQEVFRHVERTLNK